MKPRIIFFILALCAACFAQQPGYYHDTVLDSVNGSIGQFNSDFNHNTPNLLTVSNVDNYGHSQYTNLLGAGLAAMTGASYSNQNGIASMFAVSNFIGTSTIFGANTNDWVGVTPSGTLSTNQGGLIHIGVFNNTDFTMDMTIIHNLSSAQQSLLSVARLLILAIIYTCMFCYCWWWLSKKVRETQGQRQVQGSQQEFWGYNASSLSAIVYASAITSGIAVVSTSLISYGFVHYTYVSAAQLIPLVKQVSQFPAWDVVTCLFPISELGFAVISTYSFCYIYGEPLFTVVRSIVMWLGV
jgi:hypothetical protein